MVITKKNKYKRTLSVCEDNAISYSPYGCKGFVFSYTLNRWVCRVLSKDRHPLMNYILKPEEKMKNFRKRKKKNER